MANASENVAVQQLVTDSTGRAYVTATTKTTLQVQRLTAAGALDTTFGKNGSLLFVRTANAGGATVHIDASDRLVVLTDDTIVRLNEIGRSDINFARGGVLKLSDFKTVSDFTVDQNNKVYVTGSTDVGTKNVDAQMRVERFISRSDRQKLRWRRRVRPAILQGRHRQPHRKVERAIHSGTGRRFSGGGGAGAARLDQHPRLIHLDGGAGREVQRDGDR